MVYHDLPLGWLTLCKPASMQITLRINTSECALVERAVRSSAHVRAFIGAVYRIDAQGHCLSNSALVVQLSEGTLERAASERAALTKDQGESS